MKQKIKTSLYLYITCLLMLEVNTALAQNVQIKYKIMLNGSEMGSMSLQRSGSQSNTQLSLESKAKKRFIVSFEIYEKHMEVFQNNIMITASVFRQVNGKTKIDKQMSFEGSNYKIVTGGKTSTMALKPVSWSVLNLYFAEPVKINEVFSGSFQQMLKIEDIGNHSYKILLPDGNSNYFYYRNGIC
ncbi:MAG TPA: DUF6134 family protein, partial [Chitinophagaceae bacterium]|nr:DUF6134 family protein [Chitinophagaceae bacterium]